MQWTPAEILDEGRGPGHRGCDRLVIEFVVSVPERSIPPFRHLPVPNQSPVGTPQNPLSPLPGTEHPEKDGDVISLDKWCK